jgi:murein DD-endopeptidase MepM/ murein hydrolase activator NlpD
MVRNRVLDRIARVSLVLALPAVLAACASGAPEKNTYVWNLKSDAPATTHHRHHPVHSYETAAERQREREDNGDVAVASAAPLAASSHPAWYTPAPAPATTPANPRDDVSPQQTAYDSGSLSFQWPVRGRVISDFGSTASGERNDGINIATQLGTPIHAAASGQVSYAGNELKGYGNLVLIRHSGNYVTAYAHAERLIVARGDTVTQGQVIGYAGDTGDVTEPQLHFEIRHGVEAINPRPLLVASR